MSKDKDNSDLAPDLPQSDGEPETRSDRTEDGRFVPGNRAGARFKPGNRVREKHGLRTRKRATIDRRRAVDRRVLATIAAVEEALAERLSPQRRLILANIGRRLRDLAKMETWEAENGIFDERRRALNAVTESKHKLFESMDRALERLGLDVTKRKGPALQDVVKRYADAAGVEAPELESETDETDTADEGAAEPGDESDDDVVDVTPGDD